MPLIQSDPPRRLLRDSASVRLFLLLFAVALAGCEQSLLSSRQVEPTLIGRWHKGTDSTASVTLELKRDGTFDVMRHSEPPVESGGEYTVADGVLTLIDQRTPDAQCRNVPGVYRYNIVREVITFTKVSDPCAERSDAMSRPWRRLGGPSR